MKRQFTLFIFTALTFSLYAQNEEKSVNLDEVTIQGAQVVNKIDGKMIHPTDAQKESSNNGYSILQKLSLPNIRINEIDHTVTAIDNSGSVQIRINNIIVDKQELQALDPKTITKIDFIDNPGVRYGDDIAYVINIYTRRKDSGYTVGADATTSFTALQGEATTYGKWNYKKSELSLSYNYSGAKLYGILVSDVADYTLDDGSIYTISRKDEKAFTSSNNHNIELTYNLADSTAYVFQASLNGIFNKTPKDYNITDIADGTDNYTATSRYNGSSNSSDLDLYFFRQITPRQSITANAVGTYISTNTYNYNDEGGAYQYYVDGKTASALSEIIYENRLKPFTLSAGINYSYKYTNNKYTGDTYALTEMNQNKIYGFSGIKGSLKAFRYSIGAGISYMHYKQDEFNYDFWTFRPKLNLYYRLTKGLQLSYSYKMYDKLSSFAMMSDATIKTNSMEYKVGNPNLKPSRFSDHRLQLLYNKSRLQSNLMISFRHCDKPNMELYERTAENKFKYTQTNQKEIDILHISANLIYWFIPEKLQFSVYGGMQRYFNYGTEYSHFSTFGFYMCNITAYLGNFTLQADIDNGSRWLEGETKGYLGSYTKFKGSYDYKDWQFSLTWTNPFCKKYISDKGEVINRNLHKMIIDWDKDEGCQVALNVSWRLSRGKEHKSVDKTINLSDKETGIMQKK